MTKTKQNGFTLIELIIVVTIIAVLASIAFLSLSGETSQARDAKREADLKTFEDSISMSNAKNRSITYLTPTATTNSASTSDTTDVDFIQTDKGKIRVLRNAKAFQVGSNFIDSTILSTVPRDPKGSPYMVAFINANVFQLVATLEEPETKIPEALVKGSFKPGAVVDNILVSIDNDDTLIPVGNASQFIQGDIIQIDTEKMTVKEIAINDSFLIVERDAVNSTLHNNRSTIKLQRFATNASSLFCVGNTLATLNKSVATANLFTPALKIPEGLSINLSDINLDDMYTCNANETVENGKTVIVYGVGT